MLNKALITEQLRIVKENLRARAHRLVLVESCTAGMVAALLGQIPGISNVLCGSLVVYRNDSKHQWLGVDQRMLDDPKIGPVSEIVTNQLAINALRLTPEATIAAAITGHLGPGSPEGLDGVIFTAVAIRGEIAVKSVHRLESPASIDSEDWAARESRQIEAAIILLKQINEYYLSLRR